MYVLTFQVSFPSPIPILKVLLPQWGKPVQGVVEELPLLLPHSEKLKSFLLDLTVWLTAYKTNSTKVCEVEIKSSYCIKQQWN